MPTLHEAFVIDSVRVCQRAIQIKYNELHLYTVRTRAVIITSEISSRKVSTSPLASESAKSAFSLANPAAYVIAEQDQLGRAVLS